ncbi:hypothetical protein SAMN06264849_10912 [Melghirimyces algeriensis]|uniref:Uncharacterized protein n=1 Tax=Melghirimyces algeriensis TaxID=910412 RepID=A0A521EF97_9BACL|nr:hypothetical protein SAMN06264849_10912 [Melghirimyces algeriensis]
MKKTDAGSVTPALEALYEAVETYEATDILSLSNAPDLRAFRNVSHTQRIGSNP